MEIQQLKSDVVDKIAAGEVVERPSHLLKELLENSVDAGASKIEIEVDEGGKSLSVVDNGRGVVQAELPLVFARHATSKIKESDDLWRLSTFGFRGEALASISSVSRLSFTSRRRGEKNGYRVFCEFGHLGEVLETSSQEGTKVQVTDLFQNIPARLKFLKSDAAELTQIKNVIKAMAMQHPQIEWKFKSKGKLVFFWQAESLLERAKKVLETEQLFENTYEYEGFKSHVIFSDPSNVVRVSRQIWTFVQSRWVQDRGLQAAVMEAYRSLLMHGQYPICLVSVQCAPDEVDVNIHPTKSQVKFVDPKKAFRVVHYALREAVEQGPWHQKKGPSPSQPEQILKSESFLDNSFKTTHYKQKSTNPFHDPGRGKLTDGPSVGLKELRNAANRDHSRDPLMAKVMEEIPQINGAAFESEIDQDSIEKGYWSHLQVIGQVDLTYIVTQTKGKMILVDQHAAHERVAFERLMKSWKDGDIEVQNLLIPVTIDLEEPEMEAILGVAFELKKLGVEVEQDGPTSLAIGCLPSIIKEKGLVEALKKLAGEVQEKGGSFALETAIGDLFATMDCHSVVRAGQALSHEEMNQLLKDMDEFPLSGFCPHGRSVSIEFPFSQLEKEFGRRA